MPRAPTTSAAFSAVAEPRRRDILNALRDAERPVGDIALALDADQPAVSKHLRVLKEVGLVTMRRSGRHRLYSINGPALKEVHDWAQTFEHHWQHHLNRVKQRAERQARDDARASTGDTP